MSRQRSIEAITVSEYVTIGELVRLTDMRYSTLKFYTSEGILPFEQEEVKLTRRYNRKNTIKILDYIKDLKRMGLTMIEIKEKLVNDNIV